MHDLNYSNFCLDSDHGHSHPMLAWDSMPPSGGSQVHTHMHGFVGRGHKLGHFRRHREIGVNVLFMYNGPKGEKLFLGRVEWEIVHFHP